VVVLLFILFLFLFYFEYFYSPKTGSTAKENKKKTSKNRKQALN